MEIKNKKELEQYYLETTYSVFIAESKFDIRIGEPVPAKINTLLDKEKTAAIITAWNPRSEPHSLQENKRRNRNLRISVSKKNHKVFAALGQGNDTSWPAEESFLILGVTKEDAGKLAVDYEQNAFVFLEHGKTASLEFSRIWSSL